MRTCWGITKSRKWLCRKPTGNKFFCDDHRRQPFWWAFGAFSAIAFSYLASWLFSLTQAVALTPSDFQIRLDVSAHMAGITLEYQEPKFIDVYTSIGSVLVQARLSLEPDSAREFFSVKNPTRSWRYTDKSPIVTGLRSNTSLESLIGKTLKARVPLRVFKAQNTRLWIFNLRVYLRGREIISRPNNEGVVELQLTKKNLGIDG